MGVKTTSKQNNSQIHQLLEKQRRAFFRDIRDHLGNNESSEKVLLSNLNDQELSYFQKIETAFKRLESGNIGTCVSCKNEIDHRRLKARPLTVRCFECQTIEDKEETKTPGLDGLNGEEFRSGSFLGRGCHQRRTD